MRTIAFIALLCGLAIDASSFAAAVPRPGLTDPRVRWIDYDPQQVVSVVGVFRTVTEVVFATDETIQNVALGDTVSWEVAAPTPNLLFIKPREKAEPTNLIVTTMHDGVFRNYTFELKMRAGTIGPTSPNTFFQIQFHYPADEAARKTEEARRKQALQMVQAVTENAQRQTAVAMQDLDAGATGGVTNLKYSVQGASSIQPAEISDNGLFTRLRFPAQQEVPSIYVVKPDGTESLVPFDVRGEYVVVHQVAREMRLRSGSQVLCIYNEGPPRYGPDYNTETTSPSVLREIKEKAR